MFQKSAKRRIDRVKKSQVRKVASLLAQALTGVAAVFGQPVFEFVEPRRERGDHLLLLIKPGRKVLDEIYHGIDAPLVYRYDVFTRHHGECIIFRIPPPPQSARRLTLGHRPE